MLDTVNTVAVALVVVRLVMVDEAVFAKILPVTTKLVVVAYVVVASSAYNACKVLDAETARLVEVTVPVAVRLASEESPEISSLPWIASLAEGEVVPMPSNPPEVRRNPSDKRPERSVEKRRSPDPAPKFWVRRPVMAEVVVALVTTSCVLKTNRAAVLVAPARFESASWVMTVEEEVSTTSNFADGAVVAMPTLPETVARYTEEVATKPPVVVVPVVVRVTAVRLVAVAFAKLARPVMFRVPVAMRFAIERSPETNAFPCTANVLPGVEVETPRYRNMPRAEEAKTSPEVMVNPLDDARPPAEIPPVKVEVAASLDTITPEESVRPLEEESPAVVTPPEKVEVAVPCASKAPEEIVRPLDEARPTVVTPPRKVEVAEAFTVRPVETTSAEVEAMLEIVNTVAVAFVVVRLVRVEEATFASRDPVMTRLVVVENVVVAFRTYNPSMVELPEIARFAVVKVPVAVIPATVRFPEIKTFPCTARVVLGVVVATPTLPPSVAR